MNRFMGMVIAATRRSFLRDRLRAASAAAAIALGLGGCATYAPSMPQPQPGVVYQEIGLGIGDLLAMLRAGRPQAEIVADLRSAGLRTPPAPADIDILLEAGASAELIQAVKSARASVPAQEILTAPVGASSVAPYPGAPIAGPYDYGPYDPYPGYWVPYSGYYAPWFPFTFGFGYYGSHWSGHYRSPAPHHVHPGWHPHRPGPPAPRLQPRTPPTEKPIPGPRVLPGKRSR